MKMLEKLVANMEKKMDWGGGGGGKKSALITNTIVPTIKKRTQDPPSY